MVEPVRSITVFGRRWFQRGPGNTYCTAEIIVNGEFVHKTERTLGGGDYYIQDAFEWLDANGYTARPVYNSGSTLPPWQYCQDNDIKFVRSVTDVRRERDL